MDEYSTHFTIDFSTDVRGIPTTPDVRLEISRVLGREDPYCSWLNPYDVHSQQTGTVTAECDWPPDAEDGHEEAFRALSARFPGVFVSVSGRGRHPGDDWTDRYLDGRASTDGSRAALLVRGSPHLPAALARDLADAADEMRPACARALDLFDGEPSRAVPIAAPAILAALAAIYVNLDRLEHATADLETR